MRWRTQTSEETRRLGSKLVAELGRDSTVLLYGELGVGKTVLAQGIAQGLGIAAEDVQSPSYTLIREHHTSESGRLIHVDLYRLEPADLPALGLEEILAAEGFKVVEWAERLDFPVPGALRLRIERGRAKGERRIETLADFSSTIEAADRGQERTS